MQYGSATPPANPNPASYNMDNWDGRDLRQDLRQVPMSTRDVATPGNRPGLFLNVNDRGKAARQPDFYDPYFPLRFIEVPKCELDLNQSIRRCGRN